MTLHSIPFNDPGRGAKSQVPFVFAFRMKNNVFGWCLGLGYEKVCHSFFLYMLTNIF